MNASSNRGKEILFGFLYALWDHLPFISGLRGKVSRGEWWEAFKEWVIIFGLSLVPILFATIVDFNAFTRGLAGSFNWNELAMAALKKNFQQGELFIYAITSLGPPLFILYKYNKEKRVFKNILSFQISSIFIVGIGSLLFALQRSGDIGNSVVLKNVKYFAFWLYVAALGIMYLSVLYNNVLSEERLNDMRSELDQADRDQGQKKISQEIVGFKPE